MSSDDLVEFIVFIYDDQVFQEERFNSIDDLFILLNNQKCTKKACWIEVINRSDVELPEDIKMFCEYFNIHPLTIEDITNVTPYIKLDLFPEQSVLYLLMKIMSWENNERITHRQISFYLKSSRNILITFQERTSPSEFLFDDIRNRLRRQRLNLGDDSPYHLHGRLRQMNVDYLFYCFLDAIIDKYMFILEEVATYIDKFDEQLMTDKSSLSLEIFYKIYHVKHDLLHLRILFHPLVEIISRLQRTSPDERVLYRRIDRSYRLDLKHRLVRRNKNFRLTLQTFYVQVNETTTITNNSRPKKRRTSIVFSECIYIYLNDLQGHVNQLIDTVEIQRESVAMLTSFWITLNNNETQEILKFLMLISVLFMPCILLTGMNSTNFQNQPQYQYKYGYYIILILLGAILFFMITWYKVKRWI
ncbi:hypothetical protein I4U23_024693 [Adineta vaga]|nr:hypothetical protein I4U23_024693 [Adineta vaga]